MLKIAHEHELCPHSRWVQSGLIADGSMGGGTVLAITYGYKATDAKDKFILMAEKILVNLERAVAPGKWLVDLVPLGELIVCNLIHATNAVSDIHTSMASWRGVSQGSRDDATRKDANDGGALHICH
jgi:hypothetical protein